MFKMDLNDEQRRAAKVSGVVLVVAGPGTGKTKTLTARIAYLIGRGVAAQDILALTFTKKAAEEMQTRVKALIPNPPKITTFHGLCYELLGSDEKFVSELQRMQIIKSLPRPIALKGISTRELGLLISRTKNSLQKDEVTAKMAMAYNAALKAQGLCDFDDLLVEVHKGLQNGDIAASYKHILVDEFQDTNRLQYEILKRLGGKESLFVIGDPNQSIYGFRGASGDIFAQCKKDFLDHNVVTLTTNYRSVPAVINLANAIFPNQQALQAKNNHPGKVRAVQVLNEYSEADWVLAEIQKAIGGGDFLRAVSDDDRAKHRTLRDFAILYRNRSAGVALQKAIDASGLPYQIVGDGSPYEQPAVAAVVAVLRAMQSGKTEELDSLSPDNQRKAAELVQKYIAVPPHGVAEKIIQTLGLELSRDLSQLLATLVRFKTVQAALEYIDDIAQSGFYDPWADAITLLTIHASKGLEFSTVFLIGVQEGVLPSERGDPNEEKRLFYVAVTRAKERLEVTYGKNRGGQPAQPSSFLAGLPLDTVTDPDMQAQTRRLRKHQAKRSQQSLF